MKILNYSGDPSYYLFTEIRCWVICTVVNSVLRGSWQKTSMESKTVQDFSSTTVHKKKLKNVIEFSATDCIQFITQLISQLL